MRESKKRPSQDVDDLLSQIDGLLDDPGEPKTNLDVSQFSPADTADDGEIYANFSNGYGSKPRNYSNGYESAKPNQPQKSAIPAYNADFRKDQRQEKPKGEYRDYGQPSRAAKKAGAKAPKKRRGGCCGCGCGTMAVLLVALVVGAMMLFGGIVKKPVSPESLGQRKPGVSTVLLCGTDKDGTRTDTMMLIYMDTSENRVGLLSLPRDTLTRTDSGKRAKLNSAYGRNGCGEEGMAWVMEYVRRIIGYKPDGYILVDMELVPKVVDLMGGVDVYLDHHIRVETDGVEVYVDKGQQHLNGEETLATLRYRYGYSNADLGRVQVQRMVIKECMKQWVTPLNLVKLPAVMDLIEEESLTDLELNNFLWIAQAILKGADNMTSDTLPGYAEMRGGASYFVLYPKQVAELVNESYNPYTVDIRVEDLTIEE